MENPPFSVFRTVLTYSVFIILSPIATFFFSKHIFFQGLFGSTSTSSNVWSAVFAVVVLHFALGLYIYKAYFEAEKAKPGEKID